MPGKTGCWACLAERIQANAPVLAYLESKRGHTGEVGAHRAATPATLQAAWALAATAVASWVARGELPHLEGKVRSLDVLTAESQTHTLVRLPSCPVCGEPVRADRPVRPVVVDSCKKTYTEDGGHRTCSPQQTLERFGHHVSPITGAVPMLERDGSGSDGVMHVYLSGHNSARRARSLLGLRADLRSSNCGKGTTDAQAKASALCEGLERYSGSFRGDEPRRRARLADLGDAGIAPNTCLLFSDRQYRERDVWNAAGHRFDAVPLPFDPTGRNRLDAGLVAEPAGRALPAGGLLLVQLPAGRRPGLLLRLLQRQRRRQHHRGGHLAGFPGTGRARQRRPVVVQPGAPTPASI